MKLAFVFAGIASLGLLSSGCSKTSNASKRDKKEDSAKGSQSNQNTTSSSDSVMAWPLESSLFEKKSPLPAHPGEAGTKTLAGVDADTDGIRDDVQLKIHELEPVQKNRRVALRQAVLALQGAMLQKDNKSKKEVLMSDYFTALDCIDFAYGNSNEKNAAQNIKTLESELTNTHERKKAFARAQAAASGGNFQLNISDSACNFNTKNGERRPK
jgi:hypothetical protein